MTVYSIFENVNREYLITKPSVMGYNRSIMTNWSDENDCNRTG